jgi:hypothetical protein
MKLGAGWGSAHCFAWSAPEEISHQLQVLGARLAAI